MQVYVVAGYWDYEGSDFESFRVFSSRESAQAYYEELVSAGSFDGASLEVREVL